MFLTRLNARCVSNELKNSISALSGTSTTFVTKVCEVNDLFGGRATFFNIGSMRSGQVSGKRKHYAFSHYIIYLIVYEL